MELVTFSILSRDMDAFRGAFAKLARRAEKLGVERPTFSVLGEKVIKAVIDDATGEVLKPGARVTDVTVSGQAPKLNGWALAAKIQHGESGNILYAVPGVDADLTPYREVASDCDHCKTRRYRNDTFVVVGDGNTLQVGRTCLKDFTGHKSPEAIARWAELLSVFVQANDFDPDSVGMGNGEPVVALREFLAQAAHEIALNGWLSRGAARDRGYVEQSTANQVWGVLFMTAATAERLGSFEVERLQASAVDFEKATAIMEYAEGYFDAADESGEQLDDYEWNLRMVVQGMSVDYRASGLAASIVPWYERKIGREIARKRRAEQAANSVHVGKIKERREFKGVTVERVFDNEGQYGWTHFHIMTDADGNCLTWRSSSRRMDPGTVVDLKGTVKDHTEYQGIKQTVLTRCVEA